MSSKVTRHFRPGLYDKQIFYTDRALEAKKTLLFIDISVRGRDWNSEIRRKFGEKMRIYLSLSPRCSGFLFFLMIT